MERKKWQLNAAFEYIMEKRQTFWDKKESGLSFCRLFRSSLKKQLEKQKLQYSLLAEKNVKVFFTCLKKSDADQRVHTHTRAHTHTMDDIQHVVNKVVEACAQQGVDDVSKILAALVARTTIYENPDLFAMDKMLEDSDVDDLCDMCVERLTQRDSPSLSTIRIQVRFDTAYLEHTDAVEAKRVERLNKLNMIKSKILDVHAKSANDFESLTDLYRQIFAFLMVHVGNDVNRDNAVEREVAAALESVFPRIGLKAFMTMSRREKEGQLNELANIVLGIRLFNKDIGKGGAGIVDEPALAMLDVGELHGTLQSNVDSLNAECQRYTDVLNYCWKSALISSLFEPT